MRKASNVCDYFVIASGTSTTQVGAIADHVERRMKEKGERLRHIEGAREGLWILLDYTDVVVHVFLDQTRRFYDLERLWADRPQERFREKFAQALPKSRLKAAQKRALRAPVRRRRALKKRARRASGKRRSA